MWLVEEIYLHVLHKYRWKYPTSPLICHLNINFLRNKILDLRIVLKTIKLDCLVFSENKLDDSFPSAQFIALNSVIRNSRYRNYLWRKFNWICQEKVFWENKWKSNCHPPKTTYFLQWKPFKMIKNYFYFTLNTFLFLKIFKFFDFMIM